MTGSLLWLGIYLTAGTVFLWVCYNTGTCLVRSRLERNARIVSVLATRPAGEDRTVSSLPGPDARA